MADDTSHMPTARLPLSAIENAAFDTFMKIGIGMRRKLILLECFVVVFLYENKTFLGFVECLCVRTVFAARNPLASIVALIDVAGWVEFRKTLSDWGIAVTKRKMSAGKGALLQS